MSRIKGHINFTSILPYIRTDYGATSNTKLVYVLDNNVLSNLAQSARNEPQELHLLLESMAIKDAVILIPEIILDESNRNVQSPEQFQAFYEPLFKMLANYTEVFIISFDEMFDLVSVGAINSNEAYNLFQLVAKRLYRTNKDISAEIEAAKDVKGIENALLANSKDAGERVIHLLVCTLLIDGLPKVHVFSNEERGVFNVRKVASKDETLREVLRFPSQESFLNSYVLHSFDSILYKVLMRKKDKWNEEEHLKFIDRHRIGNMKSRKVRYSLSTSFSDIAPFNNEEFVDLIISNNSAVVSF